MNTKLYFSLYQTNGNGFINSGHHSVDCVDAEDIRIAAVETARHAFDAQYDWSAWKVQASTEEDGRGEVVEEFDFIDLIPEADEDDILKSALEVVGINHISDIDEAAEFIAECIEDNAENNGGDFDWEAGDAIDIYLRYVKLPVWLADKLEAAVEEEIARLAA